MSAVSALAFSLLCTSLDCDASFVFYARSSEHGVYRCQFCGSELIESWVDERAEIPDLDDERVQVVVTNGPADKR